MAKIGKVYIYDLDKFNPKTELELSCRGVSTMILVDNQVCFHSEINKTHYYINSKICIIIVIVTLYAVWCRCEFHGGISHATS
jgi:hypothetical protein